MLDARRKLTKKQAAEFKPLKPRVCSSALYKDVRTVACCVRGGGSFHVMWQPCTVGGHVA